MAGVKERLAFTRQHLYEQGLQATSLMTTVACPTKVQFNAARALRNWRAESLVDMEDAEAVCRSPEQSVCIVVDGLHRERSR